MVEPTFLVGLGIVFFFILLIILRNTSSDSGVEQKRERQKKQIGKEKKPKGIKKNNAVKKEKRVPDEIKEWTGVDTAAKDAQDMLEFLKGKDPIEIAKLHNIQVKQQNKKKQQQGKKNEESHSSEDSNEVITNEEGFSVITNKKPKSPKEEDNKKKQQKKDGEKREKKFKNKTFYKDDADKSEQKKNENKKKNNNRFQRKTKSEGEDVDAEGKKKPLEDNNDEQQHEGKEEKVDGGEKRERKERKRERSEGEEGQERPKRQLQQRKAPPTVPPNVKYEEADLNDILNSITQDYKPKPKVHRITTLFSKIPRNMVLAIVSRLEACDLLALSEVNHYFIAITRTDFLWKDLLLKDFGIRDLGKYRNFRAAYRGEHNRKKMVAKKKKSLETTKESIPQDDAKDTEKPNQSKGKKEKKPANEDVVEEQPIKEQEKLEDQ